VRVGVRARVRERESETERETERAGESERGGGRSFLMQPRCLLVGHPLLRSLTIKMEAEVLPRCWQQFA
jgi:hypothetical protein